MTPASVTAVARAIGEAARRFYARGWMMGTSGNLSGRVADPAFPAARFCITASGVDKGALTPAELLLLDGEGRPLATADGGPPRKASAETAIHLATYHGLPDVRYVYHVHGHYATLVSRARGAHIPSRGEPIAYIDVPGGPSGFEIVKGFDLWSEDDLAVVPVFYNHPQVSDIADDFSTYLRRTAIQTPAMVIAGHGLTAWGKDAFEALRHVEVTEFVMQLQWEERLNL